MKCCAKFALNVKYWNRRKNTPEYVERKLNHNCAINHTGSAGSMEAARVLNIFKRSVETKKTTIYIVFGRW